MPYLLAAHVLPLTRLIFRVENRATGDERNFEKNFSLIKSLMMIFEARFLEFVLVSLLTVSCWKIHFLQAGNCIDDGKNFLEFCQGAVFGISRMESIKSGRHIEFEGSRLA